VDIFSLNDQTIEAIYTYASAPVHPAWINEQTTPVATSAAVLKLTGGQLVSIDPCEVQIEEGKYPSLGLEFSKCDASALRFQTASGEVIAMQPLELASAFLPFHVNSVAQSDPLQEGAVSEYLLIGPGGARIVFRHIMPPMTLGIAF